MFAVGHMALAYLLGKGASKALRTKINIPILFVLAILPDIDIIYDLLTGSEIHRGPTHSVVVAALVFIPIFIKYRKTAIPYFLALISHSLIADFFIGGQLQLFWPLSTNQYGIQQVGSYTLSIFSPINVVIELLLFITSTLIMYKAGDMNVFFTNSKTNLVLIIPITTVLLPSTIGYPFTAPLLVTEPAMALAHLFYLVLFGVAVVKALPSWLRRKPFSAQTSS